MKIEVFSTGGGIWLAEVTLAQTYGVVSSECPDVLTVYHKADTEKYLPENMLFSLKAKDLPPSNKAIYEEMRQALEAKVGI